MEPTLSTFPYNSQSLNTMILLLVCATGLADAQTLPAAPNFLFVFIDDQAWDATSVQMIPGESFSHTANYRMPNLEQIASDGITFSQAYATHPKCEGSRSALQMGRTSTSLNAVDKFADNWSAPPADSIANALKRANPSYRAAHFGKWQWPAPYTPDAMGYDVSDGITMNADGTSQDPNDPKLTFSITRRAEDFMDEQVREGHPFYLQLSYYATHGPNQALASTLEKYSGDGAVRAGKAGSSVRSTAWSGITMSKSPIPRLPCARATTSLSTIGTREKVFFTTCPPI